MRRSGEVNERGVVSGKFGWCVACRGSAEYYCKASRLPVCSFGCKQMLAGEMGRCGDT